jgi:excinuclease ABC subunit C
VQLDFARRALCKLGLGSIAAVALAKREEEIFIPEKKEAIRLDRNDPGLKLLERVRDEAHRFAITSHRRKRESKFKRSLLEEIQGLGKNKVAQLLSRFGSVRAIAKLKKNELAGVPGVGPVLAERIIRALDVTE